MTEIDLGVKIALSLFRVTGMTVTKCSLVGFACRCAVFDCAHIPDRTCTRCRERWATQPAFPGNVASPLVVGPEL